MSRKKFRKELVEKLTVFITAGFALAAALAWNDAVQGWLKRQVVLNSSGPFVYAVVVTFIAVIVAVFVAKIASKVK